MGRAKIWFWAGLGATLLASRLAHINILWADEDYHLAAAIQVLQGKMLYRDVWYDKPPLNALLLALFGAWPGWPLRIASTALAIGCSVAIYRFAAAVWSEREGFLAAGLLAFFQIFYFPNAVLTLEPDTFLVLPHILAVYWAWKGRGLAAGMAAGVAFLLHPKAALILLPCVVFAPGEWLRLATGFVLPNLVAVGWLMTQGAWPAYLEQVWQWGVLYTASPPDELAMDKWLRLAGWFGFHSALLVGVAWHWRAGPRKNWRWIAWCVIALVAAGLGWRFSPRYLNFLLPPLVMIGSAGLLRATPRRIAWAAAVIALAIPAVRFGPRNITLAAENFAGAPHSWADVQMDRESRAGATLIRAIQRPGDTLFIWGYRPNVVVYTRLPVASRLWDSQAVTGVPADRHLGNATPIDAERASRNRLELSRMSPAILVDGLSAYNPRLDIRRFPDLAEWFARYCAVPSSPAGLRVYRLCAPAP